MEIFIFVTKKYNNMITIHNSKLAKRTDVDVLSIFPFLLMKNGSNNLLSKEMIKVYKKQNTDFIGIGIAISIVFLFILFAFDIVSWWLLLLGLLPCILQPLWLGIELICKNGYIKDVSLIRQAIELGREYPLECNLKTTYTSFSWFDYIKLTK